MQATSDKTGSVGFTQNEGTVGVIGIVGDVTGNAYGRTGYNNYYQWGRKDAFRSAEYTTAPAANTSLVFSATSATVGGSIQNPTTLYNHDNTSNGSAYIPVYYNAWNATCISVYNDTQFPKNGDLENVMKTVYDPCPVGYTIAPGNAFTAFSATNFTVSGNGRQYSANGKTLYFPFAGSRLGQSGAIDVTFTHYWTSVAGSSVRSRLLYFNLTSFYGHSSGTRVYGINIRPVREN